MFHLNTSSLIYTCTLGCTCVLGCVSRYVINTARLPRLVTPLSVLRYRGEIHVEVKRGRLGRPSTSRTTTARTQQNQMSAFAVLQGAEDGDFDRLVQKKKSQLAKESAKREAEAAASRAAFDDLKAKAGQSNWADDDEEDDDFYSLPVRCAHTGTEHVSSSYLRANQDTPLLLRRVALMPSACPCV